MRFAPWHVITLLLTFSALADAKDPVANSVVKIHVTRREPDFVRPWNKGNPEETGGSGAIIEGKRILTNAHVVLYASQIFVQADQTTERVPAKVTAIAPGLDLAVVEVSKAAFFDGRPALPVATDIPTVKQTVSVYGYPIGGEQISVTQGIVSRIECTTIYCLVRGLRIQIDAALNPGNSGGPAVADGKIVGLVHSKLPKGENIGYLIAAGEIQRFLKHSEGGQYAGEPQLWDYLESTENEALRAKLGLDKETGVLVSYPFSAAADYPLKRWDVITHIGGQPVDNQGNVKIRDDLRVHFQYLVPQLAKDGRAKLTIFREKKSQEVNVPVPPDGNLVVPFLRGKYPRYFICGPMVFMPASQDLVQRLQGTAWASMLTMTRSPLLARAMDHPAFAGEEIVTLGFGLLPHKTSKGYRLPPFSIVTHLNGKAVRNLAHVVELLRDSKDEFLTLDLAGTSPPVVFRRQEVLDATDEILADEGVRKQCSDDLESVWRRKK
jgi:S1-C subfamily serine protease